jgi:predicted HD phosphohydrolase
MDQSTAEEWAAMAAMEDKDLSALSDRLLAQLHLLDNEHGGFAVDRLTHSLQTAHRAEADGRDDAYLVCALLHDVGDVLGPLNHADIAAAILKPWVSEASMTSLRSSCAVTTCLPSILRTPRRRSSTMNRCYGLSLAGLVPANPSGRPS